MADRLGGLAASVFDSTIQNCRSSVNIRGNNGIGGAVGYSQESKFINNHVSGKVMLMSNWNMAVGSFVGGERSSDFMETHVAEEVEVKRAYENNEKFY